MSFETPSSSPARPTCPKLSVRLVTCRRSTTAHPSSAEILHPCLDGVQKVLKSESAKVFIFPSTGTGGWETAITNTLVARDKVLAARNGMFSHRWIDMCLRHGLKVEIVEAPWGAGIPTDRL